VGPSTPAGFGASFPRQLLLKNETSRSAWIEKGPSRGADRTEYAPLGRAGTPNPGGHLTVYVSPLYLILRHGVCFSLAGPPRETNSSHARKDRLGWHRDQRGRGGIRLLFRVLKRPHRGVGLRDTADATQRFARLQFSREMSNRWDRAFFPAFFPPRALTCGFLMFPHAPGLSSETATRRQQFPGNLKAGNILW